MAYFLTWEPTGVYAKFVGACTVNDVLQAYQKISEHSHPADIRFAIFDYLDLAQHNMSESEIVKVAAFDMGLAHFYPALRFASVATDKRVLDLWRQFVTLGRLPGRHAMFTTVSAAHDWLGSSDKC